MKITWLGHACFKVEENGYSVILDPYQDGKVPGLGNIRETANQVICSHEHGDHNARECVTIEEGKSPAFTISQLDTFHDECQGAKRGKNKITILEAGGVRVAHLGDLGCPLTKEQAEALSNLDLLLIPVGGFFTIDVGEAADIVAQLAPKHVVPMHYRADRIGYDVIGTVEGFVNLRQSVKRMDSSVLELGAMPEEEVLVLTPSLKI